MTATVSILLSPFSAAASVTVDAKSAVAFSMILVMMGSTTMRRMMIGAT